MARDPIADQLERLAAETVAGQLGGYIVPRDVHGAPAGTHDYDIHQPNGRVVAFEVTTAAHRPWIVLMQRLNRKSGKPAAGSQQSWVVSGHYGYLPIRSGNLPDVDFLRQQTISYLQDLEAVGIHEFSYNVADDGQPREAAVHDLLQLGIMDARTMPDAPPPAKLFFGGVRGYSGPVSADNINRVVEAEIANNLAKLERAVAAERHLFIWVDTSIGAAGVSLAVDRLPSNPPTAPQTIDAVWLGYAEPATSSQSGIAALWRYIYGQEWCNIEIR